VVLKVRLLASCYARSWLATAKKSEVLTQINFLNIQLEKKKVAQVLDYFETIYFPMLVLPIIVYLDPTQAISKIKVNYLNNYSYLFINWYPSLSGNSALNFRCN
jgi:hypothetical protein